MTERPDWDEYFLELTRHVSSRATCDRGRSGCVIVRDKQILTTGYVGSPPGFEHCDEAGHLLRRVIDEDDVSRVHCVRTIHAEQNAILQAARTGTSVVGATVYCTMEPCRTCAMFIVSAGIRRVVCEHRYHAGADTREIFSRAGIELSALSDTAMSYALQTPTEPAAGAGQGPSELGASRRT
ncbi:deoxycytidylate deaminase [Jatrophihabitans sp.]|uniref:deoxycytidylate deaminase n=1 Tax=Jatrophihabitans sp. TaxID=1932789 RepID=UPI002BFDCAC7|nr:dCMP deaminase family protein [Jatrophihabitans sp.]